MTGSRFCHTWPRAITMCCIACCFSPGAQGIIFSDSICRMFQFCSRSCCLVILAVSVWKKRGLVWIRLIWVFLSPPWKADTRSGLHTTFWCPWVNNVSSVCGQLCHNMAQSLSLHLFKYAHMMRLCLPSVHSQTLGALVSLEVTSCVVSCMFSGLHLHSESVVYGTVCTLFPYVVLCLVGKHFKQHFTEGLNRCVEVSNLRVMWISPADKHARHIIYNVPSEPHSVWDYCHLPKHHFQSLPFKLPSNPKLLFLHLHPQVEKIPFQNRLRITISSAL